MRLSELLSECQRTFLSQCSAEMSRNGFPESQAKEILESTSNLLEEYNDHVLKAIADSVVALELFQNVGNGGAQA